MRRNTDGENGFGDVMPAATVHIRPNHGGGDAFRQPALQISNFEDLSYQVGSYARTMMMCATHDATTVTACMISLPASSVVAIQVHTTYGLSGDTGTIAGSGGHIVTIGTYVASGARAQPQGRAVNYGIDAAAMSLTAEATMTVTLGEGTGIITTGNAVPVVITGIANQDVLWFLDIETWTIRTEYIAGQTDTSNY